MQINKSKRFEVWTIVSLVIFVFFALFFLYPICVLLKQAFASETAAFTLDNFKRFFSKDYYYSTIFNSFKVSFCTTILSLVIGAVFSYFYTFYKLKGGKTLLIISLLCCMSAPFIGAYAWILLLGRSGIITTALESIGIKVGSIYGFSGIMLVQSTKLYPLVMIYMNGMFKNIDNSLLEASQNLGCSGFKRFTNVILRLSMPTILAAALLVFMRAFADFGTPLLIGEGYRTFPVEIYTQFLSEVNADYGFASAISVIAIVVTAVIFLVQKWATGKFSFSMNALNPIEPKPAKGIKGVLMHIYCYVVVAFSFLPQLYIIYVSFRNTKYGTILPGYSLDSYKYAINKLYLFRSTKNTIVIGIVALAVIIILAVLISYLSVRRPNRLNQAIDTVSMLPYIMPGSVIAIALISGLGRKPFLLTGTVTIMIIAVVIRRLPYTIRSSTATLIQIPMSMEEAAISLGANKISAFFRVTIPMMARGIVSGAVLSWIAIVTEVSSAVILYNNRSITLTIGTYVAISRGFIGPTCAVATVTAILTALSLMIYVRLSKGNIEL